MQIKYVDFDGMLVFGHVAISAIEQDATEEEAGDVNEAQTVLPTDSDQ